MPNYDEPQEQRSPRRNRRRRRKQQDGEGRGGGGNGEGRGQQGERKPAIPRPDPTYVYFRFSKKSEESAEKIMCEGVIKEAMVTMYISRVYGNHVHVFIKTHKDLTEYKLHEYLDHCVGEGELDRTTTRFAHSKDAAKIFNTFDKEAGLGLQDAVMTCQCDETEIGEGDEDPDRIWLKIGDAKAAVRTQLERIQNSLSLDIVHQTTKQGAGTRYAKVASADHTSVLASTYVNTLVRHMKQHGAIETLKRAVKLRSIAYDRKLRARRVLERTGERPTPKRIEVVADPAIKKARAAARKKKRAAARENRLATADSNA